MTIVYKSAVFQGHDTGSHPESPRRVAAIDEQLEHATLPPYALGSIASVDGALLGQVHDAAQIAAAERVSEQGGGYLDPDTLVSQASYGVALKAAGTAVAAVDEVMAGRHRNALCLVRPPGHHATPTKSMGFCLFNTVAIAARHALLQHGVDRILIVDWDVHHGNGTQDVFYAEENVMFFSIHRAPFYPGTGSVEETGTGRGLGATLNVPVAFGTTRDVFLDRFRSGLETAAARCKPDLVLISAGFDAHHSDPVGNLGLETADFGTMTTLVKNVADTYCRGRIVSCLEGGYNLSALAASVETHLRELVGRPT